MTVSCVCGVSLPTPRGFGNHERRYHHARSIEDVFWPRVVRSPGLFDCWEWIGSLTGDGYGHFKFDGREVGAHRFALELALGRTLAPGEFACHTCDNPPCVRPEHLYPGTRVDNAQDAVRRGRMATGDRHGSHIHPEKWRRGRQEVAT